jgi:transposase-like protein
MSRDPLDPFDATLIEAVAADHGLDSERLRTLVRRHQEQMREMPGVENLVYEWRKLLPRDPLVERREVVSLLVVEPNVWPQFADALEVEADALTAIKAVHERQLSDTVGADASGGDDREAMIVTLGR